MTLEWAPLIPLPLLALLALVLIATGLATLLGRKGSVLLRLLVGTLLILALANPSIDAKSGRLEVISTSKTVSPGNSC